MNTRRHFLIRRRSHLFVGLVASGASAGVIVTCISFSASSKVCGVTTEPAPPSETGKLETPSPEIPPKWRDLRLQNQLTGDR